jgi:hypothetical protein
MTQKSSQDLIPFRFAAEQRFQLRPRLRVGNVLRCRKRRLIPRRPRVIGRLADEIPLLVRPEVEHLRRAEEPRMRRQHVPFRLIGDFPVRKRQVDDGVRPLRPADGAEQMPLAAVADDGRVLDGVERLPADVSREQDRRGGLPAKSAGLKRLRFHFR